MCAESIRLYSHIMKLQSLQEDYPITDAQIEHYRRDGYIKFENVIPADVLVECQKRVAAAVAAEEHTDLLGREMAEGAPKPSHTYSQIFTQRVNLWQRHETVKEIVMSSRLANIAARLCGESVRIWHDQALFKDAKTGAKTPWHQDAPYWPHADKTRQLTIWIAMKDATIDNGCLSFLPGTQVLGPREPVQLADEHPKGVYDIAPECRGVTAKVVELKAGSCTFHNGLTFHYAGPNRSEAVREAFAIIYMPASTIYEGAPHVMTNGRDMKVGEVLNGETFPVVSTV